MDQTVTLLSLVSRESKDFQPSAEFMEPRQPWYLHDLP